MTVLRPVRPDDAPHLLAVNVAHQRAVLGRPDATLEDLADALADPELQPGSLLALEGDSPVGCALVHAGRSSGRVELDVVADPAAGPDLQRRLLREALAVAERVARDAGAAELVADQGCYREDTGSARVLDELGFAPATAYARLRRELDAPVAVEVPDGIVLERFDDAGETDLRRAWQLHQSSFAGHFGFVPRSWEDWRDALRSRSGVGPLWLATTDGADVGVLQETDEFLQDEGAGYVLRLGVVREARGRGIARALLLSSFAHMRERGRRAALLHVDVANATGATALYESVGMTPVRVIDVWQTTRPLS